MAILKQAKDRYSEIYENEILTLNETQLKVLTYFRVKGGENSIIWYGKGKLQQVLKIGRDRLDKALNALEETGAIIIFNAKDSKTNKRATNLYYITEYDAVNRQYITANTIDEIKNYALEIRHTAELKFAFENNLNQRDLILETRLNVDERKVKHFKKSIEIKEKPCTENQGLEPCTENQGLEPTTENQRFINKPKNAVAINNYNDINNNNDYNNDRSNNKDDSNDSVVVNDDVMKNKVKDIVESKFNLTFNKNDIQSIVSDFNNTESKFDYKLLENRLNAVIEYSKKNKINNLVAIIRKSIKNKWNLSNFNNIQKESKLTFTDYEQRSYDYDELEKKLLGWQ